MQLREVELGEFLALARLSLARGKRKFRIFYPARLIPPRPLKAYKTTVLRDEVSGFTLKVYTKPVDGGWILKVEAQEPTLNTLGEVLKKVM
jgi:hypothetical protein